MITQDLYNQAFLFLQYHKGRVESEMDRIASNVTAGADIPSIDALKQMIVARDDAFLISQIRERALRKAHPELFA